jgi:hypothetical protein
MTNGVLRGWRGAARRRMGVWAKRRGSLASFRQKRVGVEAKNWVSEAREGFWGGGGGFVLFLRDFAMERRGARGLRELRGGSKSGGRRGESVNGRMGEKRARRRR